MSFRAFPLLGVLLLSGCLFGRKATPPPPLETPDVVRARTDSLFELGREFFREGKWGKALQALDRAVIYMDYTDPRRPLGHFMMGEAQMGEGNQLMAVREFRRVADEAPSDTLAADALLRAGDAYADLWRKPQLDPTYGESALAVYRELATRYPTTPAARRAALRIQELQEMFAEKEYRAAMFYYRLKAYESAILMLRNVVALYPRTTVVQDALVRLVQSYRMLRYEEDLRETCEYIEEFFPATLPEVRSYCPAGAIGAP